MSACRRRRRRPCACSSPPVARSSVAAASPARSAACEAWRARPAGSPSLRNGHVALAAQSARKSSSACSNPSDVRRAAPRARRPTRSTGESSTMRPTRSGNICAYTEPITVPYEYPTNASLSSPSAARRRSTSRATLRLPSCASHAPFRATHRATRSTGSWCRRRTTRSSASEFGVGSTAFRRSAVRVVDAFDRPRAAGAPRVEAHQVVAGADRCRGSAAAKPGNVVAAGVAGATEVEHERAEPPARARWPGGARPRGRPCSPSGCE